MGDADQAEEEVGDGVAGGEEAREFFVQPDRLDQHCGEVVRCHINPRQLLHCLRARAQQQSPHRARAGRAGAPAQQIPPADGVLALVGGGVLDLFGLCDDPGVVEGLGFEVGDDGFGEVDLAVGDEPAGGFREPGDGGEEDGDEDELEGEGEAPGDGAGDEGEAVGYPGRGLTWLFCRIWVEGYQFEREKPAMFKIISMTTSLPVLPLVLILQARREKGVNC